MFPDFLCETLFLILKLKLSGVEFINDIVWWARVLLKSLIPLGFRPALLHSLVRVSQGHLGPHGCSDGPMARCYSSLAEQVSIMSGFPYGTTAWCEDSAPTTPIKFLSHLRKL